MGRRHRDDEGVDPLDAGEPYEDDAGGRLRGFLPPWAIALGSALLILAFLASTVLMIWRPGNREAPEAGTSSPERREYAQWVQAQAQAVVGRSRVVGVAFTGAPNDPVVALLAYPDPPELALRRMQGDSLHILRRLFTDPRATTVAMVWLDPVGAERESQEWRQVLTLVVSRERVRTVDWDTLLPQDLRDIADHYQVGELSLPSGSVPAL